MLRYYIQKKLLVGPHGKWNKAGLYSAILSPAFYISMLSEIIWLKRFRGTAVKGSIPYENPRRMRVSQGSIVKACGSKLRCIKGTVLDGLRRGPEGYGFLPYFPDGCQHTDPL